MWVDFIADTVRSLYLRGGMFIRLSGVFLAFKKRLYTSDLSFNQYCLQCIFPSRTLLTLTFLMLGRWWGLNLQRRPGTGRAQYLGQAAKCDAHSLQWRCGGGPSFGEPYPPRGRPLCRGRTRPSDGLAGQGSTCPARQCQWWGRRRSRKRLGGSSGPARGACSASSRGCSTVEGAASPRRRPPHRRRSGLPQPDPVGAMNCVGCSCAPALDLLLSSGLPHPCHNCVGCSCAPALDLLLSSGLPHPCHLTRSSSFYLELYLLSSERHTSSGSSVPLKTLSRPRRTTNPGGWWCISRTFRPSSESTKQR